MLPLRHQYYNTSGLPGQRLKLTKLTRLTARWFETFCRVMVGTFLRAKASASFALASALALAFIRVITKARAKVRARVRSLDSVKFFIKVGA